MIMMKKQRRYGGADSPLDTRVLKAPISDIMVGRKSGREANDTLVLKLARANIQSDEEEIVKKRFNANWTAESLLL